MSIRSHVNGSRVNAVRIVTAVLLCAAVASSGCGSDESASTATTSAAASAANPTSAGPRESAAVTVRVDDMKFSPAEVTVQVGDTVTWKFSDRFPHSVQGMGDKAMGINSPIYNTGEWSYTFTSAGSYRYLCSLHPEMRGTVTVR
ncbi:cupredoxin domain-containing protein [Nocardia bovistercoris]|uniref:Cupredoxin family copper-binding protein n=1 Tax=Nocardia bovistercoris TaxID=2785916 RepID=A0A931IBH0_9NOCA|nr:cupredoxin family copper-binding protein [Nocardia bovistercoris]MBH0777526.1 cupredoxin family copper-binding protein [Nocardia bovistercoris]